MLTQTQKVASGAIITLALILSGCNHSVEQAQAKQENMNRVDNMTTQALSVSEAASAVPFGQGDTVESSKSHHTHLASKDMQQLAGRYTGVITCLESSDSCGKGNIDMTLTLFADGTAVRTLVQQGLVNSMLERETALWHFSQDSQSILVYLPDEEVLKYSVTPNHRLKLENVGKLQRVDNTLGAIFEVSEPDQHVGSYLLTRQANV